jgi:hypothetical protein
VGDLCPESAGAVGRCWTLAARAYYGHPLPGRFARGVARPSRMGCAADSLARYLKPPVRTSARKWSHFSPNDQPLILSSIRKSKLLARCIARQSGDVPTTGRAGAEKGFAANSFLCWGEGARHPELGKGEGRGQLSEIEAVTRAAAKPTTTGTLTGTWLPMKGDRVERIRNGVTSGGRVFYSDQLQVLVKWDDGSSSSLRADHGQLRGIRKASRNQRDSGRGSAESPS